MDEKKKKLTQNLGDDSGEMDVIKDLFSSPEPTGGSTDIFASDLFTADPFAPAKPPAPEPKAQPAPAAEPKSPQGAQAFVPAQPAPTKAAPPAKGQIKVVTNADFEQLLQDKTSPEPSPALGARVTPPATPPKTAKPAAPSATPAPAATPAKAKAPAPPPKEESLEDLVTQAVAEDYHAVGAAKKGAALQEVEHELEGLEPMGDDFMSIEEMKKLFHNVNAMMDSLSRLCQRLDRIEAALIKSGALKK